MAAIYYNNYIVVMGWEDALNSVIKQVQIINCDSGNVHIPGYLSNAVHSASGILVGDRVYLFGSTTCQYLDLLRIKT